MSYQNIPLATSESGQFRIPPCPRITSGGKAKWRCIWPVLMHRRIKDGKVQTAIILNCAGRQVLEVYDNIARESDDDKHKADKVLRAL